MKIASYSLAYSWPAWRRSILLLLVLALLDCLGAGALLQAGFLAISSSYGPHHTSDLSAWVVAVGWAAGFTCHLIALQCTAKRHQKAEATVLLASGLLLTGLCQLVMAFVLYAATVIEVLRAVFNP